MSRRHQDRRPRIRLKWFVAAAAVLSIALFLLELCYYGLTWSRSGRFVGTNAGDFVLGHEPTHPPGFVEHGVWPSYWSPPQSAVRLSIPLWPFEAAFFPLALAAAWLFWKDVRSQIPGLCHRCGYDLAGLPEGPCPECGANTN